VKKQLDVSDARRRKGQRTVSKRQVALTAAGVLFKHAPGCKGSRQQPVEGSIIDADNRSHQQQQQNSGNQNAQRDDITTDDLAEQLISNNKCCVLKHIPKASRLAAADKFCQLLTRIVTNPDDVQARVDLLLFSSCCLKVPAGRGESTHQKASSSKSNEITRAYPGRSVSQHDSVS
jgi:hypothetical protein